jgi:hypothetical protein
MDKHTKGPWSMEKRHGAFVVKPNDGDREYFLHHKGNALLIAAAPDLLEALRAIVWKLERKDSKSGTGEDCTWATIDRNDAVMEQARQAIAKATNGQHQPRARRVMRAGGETCTEFCICGKNPKV